MKLEFITGLINQGRTSEALYSIDQLSLQDKNFGQILKSKILIEDYNLLDAKELLQRIVETSRASNNKILELAANSLLCRILTIKEEIVATQKMINEGNILIEAMTKKEKEESEEFIGLAHANSGWAENLTYTLGKSDDNSIEGNLDQAIKNYQDAIKIFSARNIQPELAIAFFGLGSAYQKKGEFSLAMKQFQNSLEINKKRGYLHGISSANGGIGINYLLQGKLNESLKIYKTNLELIHSQDFKATSDSITTFRLMGRIYFIKGNLDQALSSLKRGLSVANEFKTDTEISCCLFNLVLTTVEMDLLDEAKVYSKILEELYDKNSLEIILLRSRLAKAVILKNQKRAKFKTDAQRILETIVLEKSTTSNLTVFSMFNLCSQQELTVFAMINLTELLIAEFEHYGEPMVLDEAEQLSSKIYHIAQDQVSYHLMVKTLLLQTHYATIKGDFEKANALFEQCLLITDERALDNLKREIVEQKEIFTKELDRITQFAQKGAQIYKKEKESRLDSYIHLVMQYVKEFDT